LPTVRFVELFLFDKLCVQDGHDDQLGNSQTSRHRKRFAAEINKQDVYFAAVVRIHRARRVEHRHAMAGGKAGARPDLAFGHLR